MKNTPPFLLYFSIFIFFVSGGLYVYLYINLKNNTKIIAEVFDDIQKDKSTLVYLDKIDSDFTKINEEGKYIDTLLVKKDNAVPFIQSVETLMKDVSVGGAVDSVVEKEDGLLMTIKMNGGWQNIVKAIGLIEKLPYKATLSSVNMFYGEDQKAKKQASSTKSQNWQAVVLLNASVVNKDANK